MIIWKCFLNDKTVVNHLMIRIHGGWVACRRLWIFDYQMLECHQVATTTPKKQKKKQRRKGNKKQPRFLAERQLFLIRPCSCWAPAPALVLHTLCSQGFIAEALSVSSRSYTSTEVATGVKAGEKVKPGRQRKRTKEEEKGSREWAGVTGKTRRQEKIKSPEEEKEKKCLGRFNIYENWSLLSASVE